MDYIWEQVFAGQEWGKYPPEHVVRFVARNFYRLNRRNTRLLEVGCGPGANLWYMATEGFDVYGIDGSRSAINQCENRLFQARLKAHLDVGDFCQPLPWPDGIFDGVIDNFSLYSNRRSDVRGAMHEIHRVLKPGGKLITCWFSKETWGYGLGNEVEPGGFENIEDGPLKNRGFVLFADDADLRSLLRQFSIESIESATRSLENHTKLVSELHAVAAKGI